MTAGRDVSLDRRFAIGLGRAFGGAILFSLPMFMTMEMWWLGFSMDRGRLAVFMLLMFPLLVGLSHYIGFEVTFGWQDDAVDALVALAVGYVAAGVILLLFGIIEFGMSPDEIIGKVSIQAASGSIGALLAQNQLGQKDEENVKKQSPGYAGEIFLIAVGALFLAFNVAPTEEMVLISFMMTKWHALALAILTLLAMHAFVYAVRFRGTEAIHPMGSRSWSVFLRYTVVGYAVALLISVYALWVFGRTDGMSPEAILMATLVLGFPSAMGAAAARLIL